MKGTLYGVGVGPGDWELITLKAVRVINECAYIADASDDKSTCLAYKIASQAAQALGVSLVVVERPQETGITVVQLGQYLQEYVLSGRLDGTVKAEALNMEETECCQES